jgi:prepilin peptidase CpaA
MLSMDPELVWGGAAVACTAVAAGWDLKTRRIPNWVSGSGLAAGLVLHLLLRGWADAGWALLAALTGGAVFFVFHLAGGMGAGDVKLMAAVGALAGWPHLFPILFATAVLGGLMGLAVALLHGRGKETLRNILTLGMHHSLAGLHPHPEFNVANPRALRLPYGVAIAAGTAVVFAGLLAGRG